MFWPIKRNNCSLKRFTQRFIKRRVAVPAVSPGSRSALEPTAADNASNSDILKQALLELNSLVGLDNVKEIIYEIKAFSEIQHQRAKEGLTNEPLVLHMIFKGNPGSGKTTVARILASIFNGLGILSQGHIIEVERADLVGEYIGHTAIKTREYVKRALGGILFVDEAYSLARGGNKDFGKESIDCLVKSMEDYRDDLILVLAGYRDEMDYFLLSNPGLKSRFPIHVDFPDYSIKELLEIADLFLTKRDYYLSANAREELRQQLVAMHNYQHSGNARLVRNLIERSIRRQAIRLAGQRFLTRTELMLIKAQDVKGVRQHEIMFGNL